MARGNVLYITVDQWRGDCLSAAGHPVVRTPTLDGLAARGVRFANHWANVAPCGPSRTTLHTGMYAQNHRSVLNGTPLDARFTNVALEARRAGYAPTLFGYTDTSPDPRGLAPDDPRLLTYEGVLPCFEVALNDPSETAGPMEWVRWLEGRGVDVPSDPWDLYRPDLSHPGADAHSEWWAPAHFGPEDTETAFVVDRLIEWFARRDDADPWFVHASFIRPHPPYRNPVGYHDRYRAEDVPDFRGHARLEDEQASHPLAAAVTTVPGVGAPVDERDRRQLRATYYGMMAEVDDQLGRLFRWLDDQGLTDDTLVLLTSDHGEQAGDHWLVEKLGWWDESYHVPLIVCDPRAEADPARGRAVTAPTEHVDVLPTLCGWMGVEAPLQCDGSALQPFLHQDSPATGPAGWRTSIHWEWDFRNPWLHLVEASFGIPMEQCCLNVVRDGRWKYVHFAADPSILPPLLFDLEADPEQVEDLAVDPGHDGTRAALTAELLRWRMRHDERTLTGHLITPQGLVVHRDPHR
ncbi:alkaline phosphatase family protein [soil metagenome]